MVSTKRRKAFYIISNYRYRRHCEGRNWTNSLFCVGYNYNFDYVTCCGIKAMEKRLAKVSAIASFVAMTVFFVLRVGYLTKMQARSLASNFSLLQYYKITKRVNNAFCNICNFVILSF